MFPARAGMSRFEAWAMTLTRYVPRASGDEPRRTTAEVTLIECSPRERG